MSAYPAYIDLDLPRLHHVGIVVIDLIAAASDFERRFGAKVSDIRELQIQSALYHEQPTDIAVLTGAIRSGASDIELVQPLSSASPFAEFLKLRKGDGVHHLAYIVDDIDVYLERLRPTSAELVLDAVLPDDGARAVYLDGFAHGPTIELIQLPAGGPDD